MFDKSWILLIKDRYLYLIEKLFNHKNIKITNLHLNDPNEENILEKVDVDFDI